MITTREEWLGRCGSRGSKVDADKEAIDDRVLGVIESKKMGGCLGRATDGWMNGMSRG